MPKSNKLKNEEQEFTPEFTWIYLVMNIIVIPVNIIAVPWNGQK